MKFSCGWGQINRLSTNGMSHKNNNNFIYTQQLHINYNNYKLHREYSCP